MISKDAYVSLNNSHRFNYKKIENPYSKNEITNFVVSIEFAINKM